MSMSTLAPEAGIRRSGVAKLLLLVALATAFFTLPYLVPVRPVVSLSYMAGFSNKTAVLLFIVCTAIFAWFVRGHVAEREKGDSRLPIRSLLVALAITFTLCLVRRYISLHSHPGAEVPFLLDRQQLLAAGKRPWRDIEFPYGPLLLYPGHWLARLLHLSEVSGYYVWLDCQWIAGVVMLWTSFRLLDFPIRFRGTLFAYILLVQLTALTTEGSNYTAFRFDLALCFTVLVQATWKRTHNSYRTAAVAIAGFALGLACSLEQAIALFFGLSAYFILLCFKSSPRFRWPALLLFFCGAAACLAGATRLGMFLTFDSFSAGGLSLPILPSPHILLLLIPYGVAGCVCCRAILHKQWDSPAIALAFVGAAMLPYAMGRADLGHIHLAIPGYVLGVAAIFTMPAMRRWWVPVVLVMQLIVPLSPVLLHVAMRLVKRHPDASSVAAGPSTMAGATPLAQAARSGVEIDNILVPPGNLPCDRTYYSPTLMPSPIHSMMLTCLDRGYYRGLWHDVMTPANIERKIDEMRTRPDMPLLLENQPLDVTFAPVESHLESLHSLELSPLIPPQRHPAITFQPVEDYVLRHYRPGPIVAQGRVQVWYPIYDRKDDTKDDSKDDTKDDRKDDTKQPGRAR